MAGATSWRRGAFLVALAGVWVVSACSGFNPDAVPPSELKPPIDHPANHRIFYRAEGMKHVITLHDDGSYLFRTGTELGEVVSARDGRWSWKKTGSHQAELALDRDVWALRFAGHDSAFAVNQAAPGRTFVFQFEAM